MAAGRPSRALPGLLLLVLAALAGSVADQKDPLYSSSGLPGGDDLRVQRGFANWPLQVSLAARIAAARGIVVAMQCDWELWRHRALDAVGNLPVLCLSRHCGGLRTQHTVLQQHRPAWAFHCLHAPGEFDDDAPADGRERPRRPAPPAGPPAHGNASAGAGAGAGAGAAGAGSPGVEGWDAGSAARQAGGRGRSAAAAAGNPQRQAMSGMSNEEVNRLIANASVLVVGLPSGGAKLQPPVVAAMAQAMAQLQQIDVVVAANKGRQVGGSRTHTWGGAHRYVDGDKRTGWAAPLMQRN
jgi:hypothetical protein